MDKKIIKILTVAVVFVLVLNLVLLATNRISELLFWMIIIAAAVFSYIILPKLKTII